MCMSIGQYCGCELAGVFLLNVGFEVLNGCGMEVFYKDFGTLEKGGVCHIYWQGGGTEKYVP